jgi:N6-adenosine-specific RNA methylase IME4
MESTPLSVEQVEQAGGYSVIYADPAWSYQDRGCNGAAELHYPTMSFEQLAALPVSRIAARDAVLFLWATYPKIEEALALIPKWGFTYKSIGFQWVKTRGEKAFLGLGRWSRGNTEPCLLATRGKPKRVSASVSQLVFWEPEILTAPVTRHSAKPPEARDRIVELMGDLPRIELFARQRAPGWDAWGNETTSDIQLQEAA